MTTPHYPELDANPNFAALEEDILKFWAEKHVFEQSVAARPAQNASGSSNQYVFYDGPPFANGLPHYGHLLTGFVKDAIARYHTMAGARVERRFGWDCHGLPAEMGAEKELGIAGRLAILDYGIGKFNDYCRTSVMKYTADWEYYVNRQGRWVDFKNDYKTMDTPFMESVIWAFSELYKKGLVYEAFRVMPYSWAAESTLSNFEIRMDNATREREDKAAYVKFKLKDVSSLGMLSHQISDTDSWHIIAWTTTPWTLPSNLALAVNPEMEYHGWKIKGSSEVRIIAAFADKKLYDASDADHVFTCKGINLVGLKYEPLFPYFAGTKNAFKVIDGGDAVTEGEGTGVIHMAPGFGEIDQKVCAENGIEVMVPVDNQGKFTTDIFDIALETDRLYLRAFTPADYPLYHSLQADPEVAKTTSDGLLPEEKIRAEFDRFLADEAKYGYSQWAAFRKSDGRFIGRAGFDNRDFTQFNLSGEPAIELRYAFLSNAWGQGYATELGKALLDWAAIHLPQKLVIAGCDPDYAPSRNVLAKLGFAAHHTVDYKNKSVLYHTQDVGAREVSVKPPRDLKLVSLVVVPDTRIALENIHVSDADKAQHISEKDVQKYGLANMRIVRWLKAHGKLVKDEPYKHNYPHCYRTDTPIIYRAMSSWYVAVTKFRDRAVELNQQINWVPSHIRDGQMGHMLATAPDWSISRNRFWGTPIPIWRSESGKMIVPGSIAEIEQLSGKKIEDLHRPIIDTVTFERDGETYTRVEAVFDCWFESGSMPFAQLHYPFENKEKFEQNFPADFITEYVGQTRGWFNTLIMLSTALFDKPPFLNCICHGVVLDSETGLKYSKRLKNYRDPKEVMDNYGADALRWMMLSSPVMRGADISVDADGKFIRDVVRLNIKPLWSAFNFFTLYANADDLPIQGYYLFKDTGLEPPKEGELTNADAHILSKCRIAIEKIKASLDAYDTVSACTEITVFFDALNNWYIRRNKDRFWAERGQQTNDTLNKQGAYDTLYTVLVAMCRAAAPLLPFITEIIHGNLTQGKSVHLEDFPDVSEFPILTKLVNDMDRVRDICTAMLAVRNNEAIRVRQPLSLATVYGKAAEDLEKYSAIIRDELNVKTIRFSNSLEGVAEYTLTIDFKVAGKRLGGKMKAVGAAAKAGDWKREGAQIIVGSEPMEAGEYNLQLKSLITKGAQPLSGNDALVVLDLRLTPELEAEGRARDLVRMIQQARKDSGLHVADRITLALDVPTEFAAVMDAHGDYIREQTLAVSLGLGSAGAAMQVRQELDGAQFVIGLSKVA